MSEIYNRDFWKDRLAQALAEGNITDAIGKNSDWNFEHINKIHRKIIADNVKPEEKVIDIGCGFGRICYFFKPEQYTGMDFVQEFVDWARKLFPEYKFHRANFLGTTFKNKEFDWAVCCSIKDMVIFHKGICFWEDALQEIKRISKRVLILEYPDPTKYEIL